MAERLSQLVSNFQKSSMKRLSKDFVVQIRGAWEDLETPGRQTKQKLKWALREDQLSRLQILALRYRSRI